MESVLPSISIVLVYLGALILLAEILNRLQIFDGEFTRKIVHIGSGHVVLLAWWLNIPVAIVLGAAVVAGFMAIIANFLPILPSVNSVGRKSFGTFFYAISIAVLVSWFWYLKHPEYAAIGILVMAWGDGMAALIGQQFGQHKYQIWGMTKSWEGSLTMVFFSFLVTNIILWSVYDNSIQSFFISSVVAIFASVLEAFSRLGIDNLTVPLGSAALAFYLSQLLF